MVRLPKSWVDGEFLTRLDRAKAYLQNVTLHHTADGSATVIVDFSAAPAKKPESASICAHENGQRGSTKTRRICGMIRGPSMVAWRIVRGVVAVLLLLLATTEILACDAIASQACPFSTHTSHDSDDGCRADGCLCCCGHIVVIAPIVPVVPLSFGAQPAIFDSCGAPDVPPNRIEHPPRS